MSDAPLAGKHALVTGAGRGIGRAIATTLARKGARIAVTGRDHAALDSTVAAIREDEGVARAYRLDVRDPRDVNLTVARAAAELGERQPRLDIVINNAGVSGLTPIEDPDDARWHDILATNLTGAMYVTRAALRYMTAGGRVVSVSSTLGRAGAEAQGAYCASKAGLIGWTRALALELAHREITVDAVCPGWVDTAMAAQALREHAARSGTRPERARRDAEESVPIGRFLHPQEVAELVAYLCLPTSAGITAQALSICGGEAPF